MFIGRQTGTCRTPSGVPCQTLAPSISLLRSENRRAAGMTINIALLTVMEGRSTNWTLLGLALEREVPLFNHTWRKEEPHFPFDTSLFGDIIAPAFRHSSRSPFHINS